jgi:hypothetical protein
MAHASGCGPVADRGAFDDTDAKTSQSAFPSHGTANYSGTHYENVERLHLRT